MEKILYIMMTALLVSFNAFSMGKPLDLPQFKEVVKDQIYRGGQPSHQGLEQLAHMKVRTVLDLRNEDEAIEEEGKKVKELGLSFISIPLNSFFTPSDKDMDDIEKVLQDPSSQPVYVHCLHGVDRTGLVIGLYRVLVQKVEPKVAYQEMRQFGFHRFLWGLHRYFELRTGFDDFQ